MKHKKSIAIALTLILALTLAVPSLAKTVSQTINAVYRDIQIVVDGVTYTPKDVNGSVVEPFIYNGTTYLPVRAVAEAFGKDVAWDGENSIVYLGEKPAKAYQEVPLWNRPYTKCSDTGLLKTYEKNGVGRIEANVSSSYSKNDDSESQSITYPLNASAKTLSGSFYITGDEKAECLLKIYNTNGKIIYTSPIMRSSTQAVEFSVDTANELEATLVFEYRYHTTYSGGLHMFVDDPTLITTDY